MRADNVMADQRLACGEVHTIPLEMLWLHLESSHAGLSVAEAARRKALFGPNELVAAKKISALLLLLEQFKNTLILILLGATAISAFLGHGIEATAIFIIILFAVILGFIQDYRAERAIEALKKMAAPLATVRREGQEIEIPGQDLVPGDVLLLRAGNRIAGDARLFEAINLKTQEASLTGESQALEKNCQELPDPDISLADRRNMVYAGTTIATGRGQAIVVTTGMQTEFGKIAQLLQTVDISRTPLQENLDKLGKKLAQSALLIITLIVLIGLYRDQAFIDILVFGIALAVAVVPEALPAVVTISLAIGVQRLVNRNALMRRLAAAETLGSTTVICSDKTGTLTRDEMTTRTLFLAGQFVQITGAGYEPVGSFMLGDEILDVSALSGQKVAEDPLSLLLQAAALVSDAKVERVDGEWRIKGDPTEGALIVAAAKAGWHKNELDSAFPRIAEIPFSSEAKRMTTLHTSSDGIIAFGKGAPEVILRSCIRQMTGDGEKELDPAMRETILEASRRMAKDSLRVLAIARRPEASLENAEHDMTFLGLAGMNDPPRPEALGAIQTCGSAGIRVIMITGDHPLTAEAIARELGLLKSGGIVTGNELEMMDEQTLEDRIDSIDIFARVAPEHKLRVVAALQKKGHVVAMTGDGVNDAPALKKADIGVAMGITGTDVAKDAAAMTLLDDNFSSIVAAVEEGRGIFENIKKYLAFVLSCNIGEIGLMAGAAFMGLPMPLTAVQILYVNLATDGLIALALAVDPHGSDLMRCRPRKPRSGVLSPALIALMLVGGIWSMAVNLALFYWVLRSGRPLAEAMAMTFISLVLIQFIKAYNFRSDKLSVMHRPFANRWLNLAIIWELILLVLVIYWPFMQVPFATFDLSIRDWLLVVLASLTVSPVLECAKWMKGRGWLGATD